MLLLLIIALARQAVFLVGDNLTLLLFMIALPAQVKQHCRKSS